MKFETKAAPTWSLLQTSVSGRTRFGAKRFRAGWFKVIVCRVDWVATT